MPISIGAGVAFGIGPAGTTLIGLPPYGYSVQYLVVGDGSAGAPNTGNGGGAGDGGYFGAGGGSGVVILSVPTSFYSGTTTGSPTVTTSGANTIIKFTASGSYTA
jgi:hypothetical protein